MAKYFEIIVSGSIWPKTVSRTKLNVSSIEICAAMCTEVYPSCHLFIYKSNLTICHYGQISQNLTTIAVFSPQSSETMWIRNCKI